jgi:hypothetical protein
MEVEHITAPEFLAAARNAECNAPDKPSFMRMLAELEFLPRTRERLVFELLTAAQQIVENGHDPGNCLLWVTAWADSIGDTMAADFVAALASIILEYFGLLLRWDITPGAVHPYVLSLALGLAAIKKKDNHHFEFTLRTLREECAKTENDPRSAIVTKLEKLANSI